MLSYKCDRCGKYIDPSNNYKIGEYGYEEVVKTYDLCPDCKASFRDWLRNLNKEVIDQYPEGW